MIVSILLSCVSNAQEALWIDSWKIEGGSVVLSWVGDAPAYRVETAYGLEADQWSEAFVTKGTSASIPISQSPAYFRVRALSPLAASSLVDEDPGRRETLHRIRDMVAAQPGEDRTADRAAIAEFLGSVPELSDVVIQNDCVWARFPDGRLLTIVDNRLPPEEEQQQQQLLAEAAAPQALRPEAVGEAGPREPRDGADFFTGIPESSKAYVFSSRLIAPRYFSLNMEDPHYESRIATDLTSWLRDNGYDAVNWFPSLTALSQVKNAGVFYFEGHSGAAHVMKNGVPTEEWILVTDTTIEKSVSASFRDDIGYAIYKPSSNSVHYSVLKPFFRKYMTFGKKAFAFVNGCHSLPAKDSFGPARPAFAGWTETTRGLESFQAGRYLFDRLLGANKARSFHPLTLHLGEDPPQRPFNYFHTLNAMVEAGLNISPGVGGTPASLAIQNGDGFGILAPSIERMSVDETEEKLKILGLFDGEARASTEVTLNGSTPLDVISLAGDLIECSLPVTLKPSVGNVQVRQRGHRSNSVPLTEWWVQGKLVKWFSPGTATPSATTEVNLHFRGDVHPSRSLPHTMPVHRGVGAQLAKDSHARTVSASGTYTYPPDTSPGTVTWSLEAPAEVPFSGMRGELSIGEDGRGGLRAAAFPGNKMTVTVRDGQGKVVNSYLTEPGTRSFPDGETKMNFFDYVLHSGKGAAAGDAGTFSWSAAIPVNPPRGDYAR